MTVLHTGRILNFTRILGAPQDWDEDTNGPCGGLAIRDENTTAGHGMTSAWFPTLEEIQRIVEGAPVYLTILGKDHPPVSLSVGSRPGYSG